MNNVFSGHSGHLTAMPFLLQSSVSKVAGSSPVGRLVISVSALGLTSLFYEKAIFQQHCTFL
jgi:hypothetical protein